MSVRRLRALAVALLGAMAGGALATSRAAVPDAAPRVVSLSPSLTATLLAVGAEATLVGVDEYSAQLEPRVRGLPRVGGLFNPSVEAIVALAPTFVALVPSAEQRDLRGQLEALHIEVLALPNISYGEVLRSIEVLGERVGHGAAARARADAIRTAWREARARAAGSVAPRAVLVLQRDPLYVVGAGSFLDAMLDAAGAENLAHGFDEPYPRVSVEWLIEAAPQLILDAAEPPAEATAHWARWPSLPAVVEGRVQVLDPQITIPGPYLDRALETLAAHVRGGKRSSARSEAEPSEGRTGKRTSARSEAQPSEDRTGLPTGGRR